MLETITVSKFVIFDRNAWNNNCVQIICIWEEYLKLYSSVIII